MRRSLVLPSLIALLACVTSCRSQEDRRTLQTSVNRLEQRLQRMDDYLKSLQTGQAKQKAEQTDALQSAQKELAELRDLVKVQQKAFLDAEAEQRRAKEAQQAAEKRLAEAKEAQQKMSAAMQQEAEKAQAAQKKAEQARQEAEKAMAAAQQAKAKNQKAEADMAAQLDRERQKGSEAEKAGKQLAERARTAEADARRQAEQARAEVEKLRRELEQRVAGTHNDQAKAIEQLAQERRQVEKLRKDVETDLSKARRAAAENRDEQADASKGEQLRKEIAQLRDQLEASKREAHAAIEAAEDAMRARALPPAMAPEMPVPPTPPAAPAPGTIIVNNEEGEVHFHFHGAAPAIDAGHGARNDGAPAQPAARARKVAIPGEQPGAGPLPPKVKAPPKPDSRREEAPERKIN